MKGVPLKAVNFRLSIAAVLRALSAKDTILASTFQLRGWRARGILPWNRLPHTIVHCLSTGDRG